MEGTWMVKQAWIKIKKRIKKTCNITTKAGASKCIFGAVITLVV